MRYLTTLLIIFINIHVCNANELSGFVALQTKVKTIAIDPGFGGRDLGPIGCKGKVHAKDLNLQIAQRVATRIQKDLGIDTILTRESDIYVSLEERAAIANTHNADILISIHSNASENDSVTGVETFFMKLVVEKDVIKSAAMLNTASQKSIAQMDMILSDLVKNARLDDSGKLANNIQRHVYNRLSVKYNRVKNRGVKHAPFYIFLAAEMPSIMVQTGFITNLLECDRLQSEQYQIELCDGIVDGIRAFIKERNSTQPIAPPDTGGLTVPGVR